MNELTADTPLQFVQELYTKQRATLYKQEAELLGDTVDIFHKPGCYKLRVNTNLGKALTIHGLSIYAVASRLYLTNNLLTLEIIERIQAIHAELTTP